MTVLEAERDAEALLESAWWTSPTKNSPLPIDPFRLADRLGIRVTYAVLPPDQSGNLVLPASGDVVATLNSFDHSNRQRFTCAHEIGHYRRHLADRSAAGQTFIDYRGTLAGLGTDPEEIYANQFAAALLMPAHLVSQLVMRRTPSEDLARMFVTSVQAVQVRLKNLRLA